MLFGIRMIPYGTRFIGEAFTSIKKIQEIMLFPKYETQFPVPSVLNMAITMKNSTFSWDTDSSKLVSNNLSSNNVNLPVTVDNSEEVPLNKISNEEKKNISCLQNLNLNIEKVSEFFKYKKSIIITF